MRASGQSSWLETDLVEEHRSLALIGDIDGEMNGQIGDVDGND